MSLVYKLSRYTSNSSVEYYWKAIGRVLGYLKKTIILGLYYNNFPPVLEGYSDASWIASVSDSKSMSIWILRALAFGFVNWSLFYHLESYFIYYINPLIFKSRKLVFIFTSNPLK